MGFDILVIFKDGKADTFLNRQASVVDMCVKCLKDGDAIALRITVHPTEMLDAVGQGIVETTEQFTQRLKREYEEEKELG